ncbi:MAG: V-type ATP synthase subunit A [Myxococcales bacterium]|nr:V-type ATP synthase subunit A [Deltaproteobacteria bacterium]NNL26017.1 V-type ATP synthase subunit A [Myxococcales bacterium]
MTEARIIRVAGAIAEAKPLGDAALYELVEVGERRLLGEVIRIQDDVATIQVFEETSGLGLDEPVRRTGGSLMIRLGPGLLGSILDGTGRPLAGLAERSGDFMAPGMTLPTLDLEARWPFTPTVVVGAEVGAGDVLGEVEERPGMMHRVLVPAGAGGRVSEIRKGAFTVTEPIGSLDDGTALSLSQLWAIRQRRPFAKRLPGDRPFITGQRVFDLLFPVVEGGSVAVPGGFGTGKTVIEQSLAKYAKADIMVYVGCGERGNEMADVLHDFSRLTDPETGRSIMDRTILIVNTSNMPVAARDASVYLGMTIAEYYRDMGYHVAILADSLSRWAEALREIAARLQEMPGEEGYPTYLANRMSRLYERAGRVESQGTPTRTGAVTFISAISPPGGDFAEPVTQASLRVVGALWALDPSLAHQRQFPAVDWDVSYSLYTDGTRAWFSSEAGADWAELRVETVRLLQRDRELREIAGLVGVDALEDEDRLVLEGARIAREFLIGQNAFHPHDAFSSVEKTYQLVKLLWSFMESGETALQQGIGFEKLDLAGVRVAFGAVKTAASDELDEELSKAKKTITEMRSA